MNERTIITIEGLICGGRMTRSGQTCDDCRQVGHEECRVGFSGRPKLSLDAKVNTHDSVFEPTAPALGQRRRLGNFRELQQVSIKRASLVLTAGRHGQLDMIDGED